jgi:hypothetical protein
MTFSIPKDKDILKGRHFDNTVDIRVGRSEGHSTKPVPKLF